MHNHELDHDERTLNIRIVAVDGIAAGEIIEGNVEEEGKFRTIRLDMNTAKIIN